jgi:cytochrome b subunit of formate dehydrogenase
MKVIVRFTACFCCWLMLFWSTGVFGEECLTCHDDPELDMDRDGELISLTVAGTVFDGSPHVGFDCGDCHIGLDENEIPHADPVQPAVIGCLDCHDDLAQSHAFHPLFAQLDESTILNDALRCTGCHGTHRIAYVESSNFAFNKRGQTRKCGLCHEQESIQYLHCAHAAALEAGYEEAPTCLGCHKNEQVIESKQMEESVHKAMLGEFCVSCHVDNPEVSGQTQYGTPFITSYKASVHGKALYAGNEDAPTCINCHDSHSVGRATDVESSVSRGRIVAQCAQCHPDAAEDYLHSIHAEVLAKGYADAPVCTDCHGEHGILKHTDPASPVAAMNLAEHVCGECHGSVKLAQRYGLEEDRLSTFEKSYHGLATRGGSVEAVNCASCHGYHDVRTCDDPESWVHPDNLAKTCGHCHEGANERFAVGKMHVTLDTESEDPVIFWISTIYIWGIFIIVGGMLLHNGLDFLRKISLKAKQHWGQEVPESEPLPHRLYLRMTVNERLQHGALVISFIVLVLTGFMLRYPEAWWVVGLRNMNDNIFELRSLVHRIAAVVMCLSGAWHLGYLALSKAGRAVFNDILPRWKDLSDMKHVLLHNLGLRKSKPLFGRFSYMEKIEYWALLWGSLVMSLTGFMLWFENTTIGLLTKLGFDISMTVHFYEAILATLAIIVWHFYFVIFNPDVYPMNLAWLTGRMTEKEMAEEHPLELKRLKELNKESGDQCIRDKTAKN